MMTLLTVLIVLACFTLVVTVLLQPAKSGQSALGGSSNSVFGSTGGTTFLFRVTMWSAAFIMAASLIVSRSRITQSRESLIDSAAIPATGATSAPATATPPATPASEPTPAPAAPTK